MAKDYKLLAIEKHYKQYFTNLTSELYAAFTIALHGNGYDAEYINALFNITADIWNELVNDRNMSASDMVAYCRELTGIDIADTALFKKGKGE